MKSKPPFRIALLVASVLSLALGASAQQYTFTHFAGSAGGAGYEDGTGNGARFNQPSGIAADALGNVYVADSFNHTIRKITPAGVVTTFAGLAGSLGSSDGTGSAARFNNPKGVAVDGAGNIYVSDYGNHTIRKITPAGVVSTLAGRAGLGGTSDGIGNNARFFDPQGIAADSVGYVFVSDTNTIRKITPAGAVTTLAGLADSSGSNDGAGSEARFYAPMAAAVDVAGNVYVADSNNHTIRKISPSGVVATLAGLAGLVGSSDGTGSAARFTNPSGVAVDAACNVYVADLGNSTIRKITPAGIVTTIAGLAGLVGSIDGTGSAARFNRPRGVALDDAGNMYVTDLYAIRMVTPAGVVTTIAGLAPSSGSSDGNGTNARFANPRGVALDDAGNLYVADRANSTIRMITPGGVVSTVAGLAGSAGSSDGIGSIARFANPQDVAVDGARNVYISDTGNHTIRKITPTGGVTTIAGLAGFSGSNDGIGSAARFNMPNGVALDSAGNVYVSDTGNHTIRRITPTHVVTTVAGLAGWSGSSDGSGSVARFFYPVGLAVDTSDYLYVVDRVNSTIRVITPAGAVTTLAGLAGTLGSSDGQGDTARFWNPSRVAVDSVGDVYVTDNGTVRKITPAGLVTTIAGLSGNGTDGTGRDARFFGPEGVALDGAGNIYVADDGGHCVRVGVPAIADAASVDAPLGRVAAPRQFDTTPQTATNWEWRIIRQPAGSTAQLSVATVRNPTFTPDVADLYVFRLTATSPTGSSITTVSLNAAANGDVNGDGKIDVADLVYLINYLYSGGPAPVLSGDVNADGGVDIGDVFYFINCFFVGGQLPA